jgi:Protein of unknown function (DUF3499)
MGTVQRDQGSAVVGRRASASTRRSRVVSVRVASVWPVSPVRRCSRSACGKTAVATLTYVYADSTAVLGPLATYAEPHCYDLCAAHSQRLTAPRGWEVLRLAPDPETVGPSSDDLEALADAVREAARPAPGADLGTLPDGMVEVGRRGHLRVLRDNS